MKYCRVMALCLLFLFCQPEGERAQADVVRSFSAEEQPKFVALTFDDGPRRGTTDRLLEGLRQREVKCTFFVIGRQIPGNEDILLQMQRDGHQVGNHSYDHEYLSRCQEETFHQQINKTQSLLRQVLGEGEYWLRPPYGMILPEQMTLVQTPLVGWSVDPEDWKLLDARQVSQAVLETVQDGDIILLHDFYPSSVEAALYLVDELQRQGFFFLTVQQLFRQKGVEVRAGELYLKAP